MARINKVVYDQSKVDWEYFRCPGKKVKYFQPTPEKLNHVSNVLMHGYLNLSDENRKPEIISKLLGYYFGNLPGNFNMFYELGNFDGILGLTNITIGFKSDIIYKFWGKFNHKLFREIRELLDRTMTEFDLKRLTAATPDEKVKKLAKNLGFVVDGTQKYGFSWNNRLYTNNLMRMLREV